jgi:hypothetical protein
MTPPAKDELRPCRPACGRRLHSRGKARVFRSPTGGVEILQGERQPNSFHTLARPEEQLRPRNGGLCVEAQATIVTRGGAWRRGQPGLLGQATPVVAVRTHSRSSERLGPSARGARSGRRSGAAAEERHTPAFAAQCGSLRVSATASTNLTAAPLSPRR